MIPYPCFLISYIPYLLPSAGPMLSALCFPMAFGSSQTTEANCKSRTFPKSILAWLWVGRVTGKLCLDGPPDPQDLGPGPGCDSRGFAAFLVPSVWGKLVGLCLLEHLSTPQSCGGAIGEETNSSSLALSFCAFYLELS